MWMMRKLYTLRLAVASTIASWLSFFARLRATARECDAVLAHPTAANLRIPLHLTMTLLPVDGRQCPCGAKAILRKERFAMRAWRYRQIAERLLAKRGMAIG